MILSPDTYSEIRHLVDLGAHSCYYGEIYKILIQQVEAPVLESAMAYTKGNQSRAALVLGLSRGTLRKKLKQHGLIS